MYLAFQGGAVHAELIGSALYLKARDLLTILGLVKPGNGHSSSALFTNAKLATGIEFRNDIACKAALRSPLYINKNDVTLFLDNIHKQTRPETIFFMQEFIYQFKN